MTSRIANEFHVEHFGDDWRLVPNRRQTLDSLTSHRRAADVVHRIQQELGGELEPAEITAIQNIYSRFSGGAPGVTSGVGITSADSDAIAQGRRERQHNAEVHRKMREAADKLWPS
jgi:hypothetical protein